MISAALKQNLPRWAPRRDFPQQVRKSELNWVRFAADSATIRPPEYRPLRMREPTPLPDVEMEATHRDGRVMKLAYGLIGYAAGAAFLIALAIVGTSSLLGPSNAPAIAQAETHTEADKPARTGGIAVSAASDEERVPVWIAPTPKYPVSAFNAANAAAARARLAARAAGSDDWRLRERNTTGYDYEAPVGLSSYGEEARFERSAYRPSAMAVPRYNTSIPMRERLEAR